MVCAGACSQFGHSCFGAHGKRSGGSSLPRHYPLRLFLPYADPGIANDEFLGSLGKYPHILRDPRALSEASDVILDATGPLEAMQSYPEAVFQSRREIPTAYRDSSRKLHNIVESFPANDYFNSLYNLPYDVSDKRKRSFSLNDRTLHPNQPGSPAAVANDGSGPGAVDLTALDAHDDKTTREHDQDYEKLMINNFNDWVRLPSN